MQTFSNDDSFGQHILKALDIAARAGAPLNARFACLVHKLGTSTEFSKTQNTSSNESLPSQATHKICERLRVPNDCKELALTMAREWDNVHTSTTLDAEGIVQLLERCDAIRKPERFTELLIACECDAMAFGEESNGKYPPRQLLEQALNVITDVDVSIVARQAAAKGLRGPEIGDAVHTARVSALRQNLQGT